MKKETKPTYELSAVVWSNIRKQQYLLHMTDDQLCEVLDICKRTLASYDRDPSTLNLDKIQKFLTETGTQIITLIQI